VVPPALIGLLAGLFVRNVPLLKRTMGQPVLGVKQHRPRIAYIAGYALLVVTLVLTPIFCGVMFGDLGACFIIMFVLGGPLVIPFVNHCHAFYIQQTVSGVYWRNWRWKIRYMPYESISEILLQSNGKNGYLRVLSRNIKSHLSLSFRHRPNDHWEFIATAIHQANPDSYLTKARFGGAIDLKYRITPTTGIRIAYRFIYDTDPIVDIRKYYHNLETAIDIVF